MKIADFLDRYFKLLLGLLLVLTLTPLFIKLAYMCISLGFIYYWAFMAATAFIIGAWLIICYLINL